MAIQSRISPHTSSPINGGQGHSLSPNYASSPYRLSPRDHTSSSPLNHSTMSPSPTHPQSSPIISGAHTPMWLGTPRERHPSSTFSEEGPLNLSKPRSEPRTENREPVSFSMATKKPEKVTTPPPAHSNHRSNAPTVPPTVNIPETSSIFQLRPPFIPPQYVTSPLFGFASHLPASVLSNMTNNFSSHSAYQLLNGAKPPALDSDKVSEISVL